MRGRLRRGRSPALPLLLLLLPLPTAVVACAAEPPAPPARPNVVLILADDLGYGDLSSYGGRLVATPQIDAIAERGVRFTAAYASAAVCSPSRAGLLTGRYAQRFGHEFNPGRRDGAVGLATAERTLGDALRAAGYATGFVGKWHLGRSAAHHPLARGFDEYFGILGGSSLYLDVDDPQAVSDPGSLTRRDRVGAEVFRGHEPIGVEGHLTKAFGEEALAFVARHRDRPFFLVLSHLAPHVPLQATRRQLERVAHVEDPTRRLYAALLGALDESVGRLVQALRAQGLERNTLLVFASDNGCAGYVGRACSNAPLRGFKRHYFEGGVRVPLLAQWPGSLPTGRRFEEPVSLLDLFATAARAAGAEMGTRSLDGVDLMPYLTGERTGPPHETLYWRSGSTRAIRHGSWKLLQAARADPALLSGAPVAGRVLPRDALPTGPEGERLVALFDLARDPGEERDLSEQQPEAVRDLLARLDAWEAGLVEPSWPPLRALVTRIGERVVELPF